MEFTPKSEEQIQMDRCLPAGTYDFKVIDAEDTESKKGNEMIALKLRVYREDGSGTQLRDWILEKLEFKLRHFCETTGLLEVYNTGKLNAEICIGRVGRVVTSIEEQDGYGPQARVVDYEKNGSVTQSAITDPQANESSDGDEIPF